MIDTKLITFLEVCESKSFTSAAKSLNLTQPAVSQHIKQLEEEHKVKLFKRSNNSLILTPSGEILLKYAKKINSIYNDMEKKLSDSTKGTSNLTIGITHTSESNIAPEILADYSKNKTGIHIKLISDTIRNLYDKLNNYQIDMAIVEGKINTNKCCSILLDTDSLVAVMSSSNPLAKRKMIKLDDLKSEKLILRNFESGTTTLFASALLKNDLSLDDFNVYLEIDNVATIKDLVKKDMGISILPKSVCHSEVKEKSLSILPIENMHMMREINLVYLDGNVSDDVLDEIVSIYHSKTQI